jgi:hypothetical protein
VVNFEEHKRASDAPALHRLIETFRSANDGGVRRVYDDKNQLVIGELTRSDGARTLLSANAESVEGRTPAPSARDAVYMGAFWRLDGSAGDFMSLVSRPDAAKFEERADRFVLRYLGSESATPRVTEATLILMKPDLHSVELRLTVDRNGEAWDYDWAESSRTIEEKGALEAELNKPETRVASRSAVRAGGLEAPAEPATEPATEPGSPAAAKIGASAELEVEVNYLLDQVKANLGEQVTLTRTPDNQLRLSALVDTDNRKTQILNALRPVAGDPAVHIKVTTVADAMKENGQPLRGQATVKELEVDQSDFNGSELRHYFLTRVNGDEARADLELRQFSNKMMAHAHDAVQQAAAIKRLVENFPGERVNSLDADARTKLLSMVASHTIEYRRHLSELRSGLRLVAPSQAGAGAADVITGDGQLSQAAARLLQLSYTDDATVRSALALSDQGQSLEAIKSERFWITLDSADKLAAAINHAYQR